MDRSGRHAWFLLMPALFGCGPGSGVAFIAGSGTLPECTDPPSLGVAGEWFDQGIVTIQTAGCNGVSPGDELQVCALNWDVSEEGGAVTMVVDDEYRIDGRLCGDQLHLRGGWWLSVQDELGHCNYEDEDASEVVVEAGGNTLTVSDGRMTGTLVVQGACTAEYAVELTRL